MRRTVTTVLFLLIACSAAAGERFPQGRWSVGLDGISSHVGGNGAVNESMNDLRIDDRARGAALRVGYLLRPNLQLRIHSASAIHPADDAEPTGLELRYDGATLDLVYLFRNGRPMRPYLAGGIGAYAARAEREHWLFESEGAAVAFGAGCHLRVNRHLGLHAQARVESINWQTNRTTEQLAGGGTSTVETPVADSGAMIKLGLGATVWF